MFATPRTAHRSAQMAAMYHQAGMQSSVLGASPHHLVSLLFDGFADAPAQAKAALRARQWQAKGSAISRALSIVTEGLQGALNLSAGGALAADLDSLYAYICQRLTQANLSNNEATLDECLRLMQPLREAWAAIGEREQAAR